MSLSLAQGVGLATLGGGLLQRGAEILFGLAGPVVLGDVSFTRWEVPEQITIGGQQQLTVHRLPGGTRIVDVMGRDDAPVAWAGLLLGPEAMARALELDELRVDGRPVALMFGGYYYTVVVEAFAAEYRREAEIAYRISCVVIRDESAAPLLSVVTTAMQVAGDIYATAVMVDQLVTPPPMPTRADGVVLPLPADAIATAEAASAEAEAEGFRRGSATQAACAASLAIARASVRDGLDGAGAVVSGAAGGAAEGGIVASVADFTAALTAAEQAATMGAALGYISRAEQNAIRGSV